LDTASNTYKYVEGGWEPPTNHATYPFGFGLSYSKFEISQPKVANDTLSRSKAAKITVTVKNVSDIDGSETVQVYIRDEFSTVVRPIKELKAFQKVYLKAGESKEISFEITSDLLMFYKDPKLGKVFEPGNFLVYVGTSSRDRDLKMTHFVMK
jgi:beta-glucosidase